jgi:hypothetical protein
MHTGDANCFHPRLGRCLRNDGADVIGRGHSGREEPRCLGTGRQTGFLTVEVLPRVRGGQTFSTEILFEVIEAKSRWAGRPIAGSPR